MGSAVSDGVEISSLGISDVEAKYLASLIGGLIKLRAESAPEGGSATETGKDRRAFTALQFFSARLVEDLAGWALDHQVGLGLEGLSFVPLGMPQTRGLPAYEEAKVQVDSHRHQLAGRALAEEPGSIVPALDARRIAMNLLHSNAGAMPLRVASELETALRALEMNDVRPILASIPQSRKVNWAKRQLELQALCFWKFRYHTAIYSSTEALGVVADAFGVSTDTMRKWEPGLREDLGYLVVSNAIQQAKNFASYIAEERPKSKASSSLEAHSGFGDDALAAAGAAYMAIGPSDAA